MYLSLAKSTPPFFPCDEGAFCLVGIEEFPVYRFIFLRTNGRLCFARWETFSVYLSLAKSTPPFFPCDEGAFCLEGIEEFPVDFPLGKSNPSFSLRTNDRLCFARWRTFSVYLSLAKPTPPFSLVTKGLSASRESKNSP